MEEIFKTTLEKRGEKVFYLKDVEKELSSWTNLKDEKGLGLPFDKRTLKLECTIQGKYEQDNGKSKFKIKKITIGKNVYTRASGEPTAKISEAMQQNSRKDNSGKPNEPAKSPYNFVPLNDVVVESENYKPTFDEYESDKLSGFIDLKITAETPIYTKGEGSDFFKINDKYAIPGSSIRGMVRNLVEIVSFGKFVNFDKEKRLFHRLNITNDKDSVKEKRNKRIGFLRFDKLESGEKCFNIYPATDYPTPIDRVDREKYQSWESKKAIDKIYANTEEFTYKFFLENSELMVLIKTGSFPQKNDTIKNFKIKYEAEKQGIKVDEDLIYDFRNDATKNVKNEMQHLLDVAKENDKNKFIKSLKNTKSDAVFLGIPVWYESDGKNINHFGHCKYYRIPYDLKIKKHVYENLLMLQTANDTDITEGLFGKDKGVLAGKVYFEDAIEDSKTITEDKIEEVILQILSTPKPTSYQLYLEQDGQKNPRDWDNYDSILNGYKLYWHKQNDNSSAEYNFRKTNFTDNEIKKFSNLSDSQKKELSQYKRFCNYEYTLKKEIRDQFKKDKNGSLQFKLIKILHKGVAFDSRIRFDNLSKVELGALFFALQLPDNCRHKIGMAKPLGLGSIKIVPTLNIINRTKRYSQLFDENGKWFTGIDTGTIASITEFKNYFETYLRNFIGFSKTVWETNRMVELKAMLEFNEHRISKNNWFEETRYMKIEKKEDYFGNDGTKKVSYNEFTHTFKNGTKHFDKKILQKPSKVINNIK